MYLVRSGDYTNRKRVEVLAEFEEDVIKVLEQFKKDSVILEEVVKISDYQTSKEYLKETEKPEDLVLGKKGGKDDTK